MLTIGAAEQKNDLLRRNLEREARLCQMLILWLDCDREGENIAFEVIQVCTAINPRMQVLRARFSALIPRCVNVR
jgi:DNA topoisomerase-3